MITDSTIREEIDGMKKSNILKISTRDKGIKFHSILYRFSECTRKWEKVVIILKDHVLYELEDIEDKVAKKSYVIVGYKIEPNFKLISSEENTLPRPIEGQAFCLSHPNMKFLLFYATNTDLASKWITALQEGTLMNET